MKNMKYDTNRLLDFFSVRNFEQKNGVDLYNSRLVAFQRLNALGKKFNDLDVRNYIMIKLKENDIRYEVMDDTHEVS